MSNAARRRQPAPPRTPGWGRLLGFALAEGYLVLMATLAAFALLPVLFGWHATVIQTGSMEPHISPGDVAVVSPWAMTDPVPLGGVVQYRSPAAAEPSGIERLRLHRIVEARDDGTFTTAGDANQDVDSSALERQQITGQARLLVPFIGLPGFWLATGKTVPLVGWLLITIAALVLVSRGPGQGRTPHTDAEGPARSEAEDFEEPPSTTPARRAVVAVVGLVAAGVILGTRVSPSTAAFTASTRTRSSWGVASLPVLTLGRAATYVLLAHGNIQHDPLLAIGTDITGNVATSPGTRIDGFWPWDITGSSDKNTTGARNAKIDVLSLYSALEKYPTTVTRAPVLAGTLTPGVYTSSTGRFTVNGTLTLDARGDPSARFIFRAGTIITAENSTIVLTRGARAENVYWRSTGAVTLGPSSTARGTFLANTDAAIQSRATLVGRLYSCAGSISVTRATISTPA